MCPLLSFARFPTLVPLFLERDPGNIDSLADLLLSDLKNFPQVRELGESSARFIREELEKTWGSSHLSVLSEEEAQKWLLGVCFFYLGQCEPLALLKLVNILQGFLHQNLKTNNNGHFS